MYFCHGDAVFCLIGRLSAQADERSARTALDQRLLRGPVIIEDQTGHPHSLPTGETHLSKVRWIYHDGLVYAFPTPQEVALRSGIARGAWHSINASGTADIVENSVFLSIMIHDAGVEGTSAAYALLVCNDPAQAANRVEASGYRIIQNNAVCQAVAWIDGTVAAAFCAPRELRDGGKTPLAVDQPCMIFNRAGQLFASDPTQHGVHMNISTTKSIQASLPADGTSVVAY